MCARSDLKFLWRKIFDSAHLSIHPLFWTSRSKCSWYYRTDVEKWRYVKLYGFKSVEFLFDASELFPTFLLTASKNFPSSYFRWGNFSQNFQSFLLLYSNSFCQDEIGWKKAKFWQFSTTESRRRCNIHMVSSWGMMLNVSQQGLYLLYNCVNVVLRIKNYVLGTHCSDFEVLLKSLFHIWQASGSLTMGDILFNKP